VLIYVDITISEVELSGCNDAKKKVVFLQFYLLYLLNKTCYPFTSQDRP